MRRRGRVVRRGPVRRCDLISLEVDVTVRCPDSVPVGQFDRKTRLCSSFVRSVAFPVRRSAVNHVTHSSQLLLQHNTVVQGKYRAATS